MKYQRFVPILVPLLVWFLNQAFFSEPGLFYISLALGALLIVLSVWYLVPKDKAFWLPYIIPPLLFFIGFSGYSAVLVGNLWLQLIGLMIIWFLFSYFRSLYYYFTAPGKQLEWTARLNNLLLSGGFLTAFVTMAFLFDLPAFFDWPLYFLLPASALLSGLLFFQFHLFPTEGERPTTNLSWLSILVLTELTGIFSLLPLNFNLLALFFAIAFYFCLAIIRLAENGILHRRALKLPLILGLIIIILLLLTARWL